MMPSLRPVLPLFDFTALRWGSSIRLRPRHVFHVQRFLFHGTKSEKEKFPYYTEVPYLNRETLLRRLSFPREYMPYWSRIWWTTRWAPLLLIMSPVLLIRFCLYRPWHLPMVNEGVEGNSRAARLLRVLKFIIRLLNIVIQPWGLINLGRGPSMQPTIPEGLAPGYYSYAYVDRRDIRRGDVVAVIPPKIHDRKGLLGKRIAALGGERIRVTRCGPLKIPYKIVHVRFYHFISFFSSVFTYGHYRYRSGTAFCLGIILKPPLTQEHSVRCRLNPFWPKCNGDWA